MKWNITGKPMPDLCDDPLAQRWMQISPSFKEALARGFVCGVVFSETTWINLKAGTPSQIAMAIEDEVMGVTVVVEES